MHGVKADEKSALEKVIKALSKDESDLSVRCHLAWRDVFGDPFDLDIFLYSTDGSKAVEASLSLRDIEIDKVTVVRRTEDFVTKGFFEDRQQNKRD